MMHIDRRMAATLIVALAAGIGADRAIASPEGRWRGQLTPYLWMSGLSGTVRPVPNGPTLDVDKSFRDLLEDLDAAGFVTGLARRDDWVVIGDFSFSRSSTEGRVAPPGAPPGVLLPATARERQRSLTALVGRTVAESDEGRWDLLAGLRAWRVRVAVAVPLAGIDVRANESIADPVFAARWHGTFAERWTATLYGDVGGFGVDSRLTWQVHATANRAIGPSSHLSFGWRHLAVDWRERGRRLDLALGGPVVGWTVTFD
jgi:hypothetical protein